MRKKLKLAFEELEKELTIITQAELMQLMGGNGSGLSADASVEEVASYLHDIGVPLTQDSSGNYYFSSSGNSIMIEEVVVMGYSTGMNSSGDGQSGYSSGINGEMTSTDMVVAYLQSYGFAFSFNNGSYTYYSPNDNNNSNPNDRWQRDPNGNIVATPTGRTTTFPEGENSTVNGLIFEYKEMELLAKNGQKYIVYETTSVWDTNTGQFLPLDAQYQSNCFGLAVADGNYYFWDDTSTTTNEFSFESYKNAFFEETTSYDPNASLAVIYSGDYAIHAGTYGMTQGFTAKGMVSGVNTYSSEAAFQKGHTEESTTILYPGSVKYYRLK
ncbi:hypothetical protein FAZ19_00110 [Sphingobacterium alkalisoli]|uniref:Uncharacterized protein n=1 Tax=Sphingobacterium alkalisoli TaxID=1874115 RepID=A0A4U0H7A5_9SPHI|nr:hypothetical protein [Sphingobacterium alkalisoli]TJY67705.1 hypothetical protein FAZ19_00110 [Sphingobacterium alkalisoli]GGH11876.1 hypothetical protein GCM10011418_11050 [Sphingobacterium alkalisoli]